MIPLFAPFITGKEIQYVQQCLDAGWLAGGGEFNRRFAKLMAGYLGVNHAITCASGTSAIHLVLQLVGVKPGQTVLVSDLTFIATANPICYLGARPLLVDSHPDHWNVDVELMAAETRRLAERGTPPAAVMPAHIIGRACRLDPLVEVVRRHGIPLVEDAAEAFGATVDGRQAGTSGIAGCYSFNGNKLITTGGGGLISSSDAELIRRAEHLINQAKLPGSGYIHDQVGYNYRMSNVSAAIGTAQFEHLDEILARKHRIAERYRVLADLPGITFPKDEPGTQSSDWLTTVLIDPARFGRTRDEVMLVLREQGIETRPIWTPLHQMSVYAQAERIGGQTAERIGAQGLSLPSFTGLTEEQQEQIIRATRAAYQRR